MKINDKQIIQVTSPYHYCSSLNFIDEQQAQSILSWLKIANWHLTVMDFYSQYEFQLTKENTPKELNFLLSDTTLTKLTQLMEKLFSCKYKNNCYVVAHKLIDGQVIKIHNDYLTQDDDLLEEDEDIETHRLIIQFNDGWEEQNGGFLLTFNSDNETNIQDIFLPEHRSMFAFEISPNSYHAVSQVYSSNRYTLIYNFTKGTR